MGALKILVVVMGVLIVLGTCALIGVIVSRTVAEGRNAPGAEARNTPGFEGRFAPGAETRLDEPAGTHILSASVNGRQLVLVLQGGGPDRVAVVDVVTGRRVGAVSLSH